MEQSDQIYPPATTWWPICGGILAIRWSYVQQLHDAPTRVVKETITLSDTYDDCRTMIIQYLHNHRTTIARWLCAPSSLELAAKIMSLSYESIRHVGDHSRPSDNRENRVQEFEHARKFSCHFATSSRGEIEHDCVTPSQDNCTIWSN